MADLRLDADVFEHFKIERLRRKLGDSGVIALLRLWCYARKFRPSGELTGMDDESVAIGAKWTGDATQFISALSELILIEKSVAGHWRIHDWIVTNEWAAGSEGRSRHAKKLNHQRWYVKRGIPCGNADCAECEPFRRKAAEAGSELITTDISAESEADSSSRLVTSPKYSSSRTRRTKPKRVFAATDIEHELAALLLSLIRRRNPQHGEPDLQRWARTVELMIRVDGRSSNDIRRLIEWAQADDFWATNILSTDKLREKFDQLTVKASTPQRASSVATQFPRVVPIGGAR